MKHCLNCGKPVHDLYCSHCGQQTHLERINFRFLSREIFHFFTHLDKGFLFTSFQMIIHPGSTVKSFIEGKRKNYQSPISYFLIWTTVLVLFFLLIEKIFGVNQVIDYKGYFGPGSDTRLAISNLSIVLMAVIPFQSLYLYMIVTKNRYNYFETMVAILYALGTVILFQFLFAVLALIVYAVTNSPVALQISDSFKIIYLIWFIVDTVRLYPVNHKLLRAMSFFTLAFGTFTLWRLYGLPASIQFFF